MSEQFGVEQLMHQAWHDGVALLLVLLAPLVLALLHAIRHDRKVLLHTLGLLLFSLVGQFIAAVVAGIGYAGVGATLRELFIVVEGLAVLRIVSLFLFHVVLPLLRLYPASIIEDMVAIVAYLFWGMVRLHEHGVELTSLVATSAVITAVLAFAMQDTLGNILGGIALQLDNSIAKGEWIKVDDITGKIVDIRWRSTTIETRNWETVVIPNSVLMKNKFLVLGRRQGQPEQWRRWVWFNIDYSVQPSQVIRVVESAIQLADIPGVAREPAPNCVMMDYGDSSGRYALRYWLTDLLRDDPTDSAVRTHIFAALQRAGVKPAWPRQVMHMVEEDEVAAAQRHEGHISERITLLQRQELFSQFSDEELRIVAERLVYAPFASGDVITRQGSPAHWLYILAQGEVEVVLEAPGQRRRVVGHIASGGSGSFFGEMGLLTGATRSATVIARGDVLCYCLDKRSFEDLMHARPGLAEEVALIMAERRTSLETLRSNLDEETRRKMTARNANEVLAKVREFFGI